MECEGYKARLLPLPSAAASPALPSTSTALHRDRGSSTLFRRVAVLIAIIGFFVMLKSICTMPSTHHNVVRSNNTIFIPFVYKFSHKHVPQVMCTIEGVRIKMPIDTGSTGLLVGAPILPKIDLHIGEPAHHFFTSSRILYVGRLVTLPVRFDGEVDSYATAKVPVLIVDKSWRCPWYRPGRDTFICPPGPNGEKATERDTAHITYMGVGFGRNRPEDGMSHAVPSINPFLNIRNIDGAPITPQSMRAGYIITTKGVHLGLTSDAIQKFTFEDLQPGLTHEEDARDWAMARMCFSINGEGKSCGSMLVDTGIAQMYIRPDESVSVPTVTIRNPNKHGYAKMVQRVKLGTRIAVAFPSFDQQSTSYSFIVGEGSAVEPNYVVPARATSAPFVNTGRNFLQGYSIAFDAIGGRFGFGPVQTSSSSVL
jgi:hypothetical protein